MIAPIRLRPGDELYASSRMLFTRRLSMWRRLVWRWRVWRAQRMGP